MDIERIAFFENSLTQYGVLHFFRKSLSKALEKKGIETVLLSANTPSLEELYRNPPDITFAFNGLMPTSSGQFLCDMIEIPHVAWLVDSAHYFIQMAKSPLNILINPDQTSQELFKSFGARASYFLPHGFEKEEQTTPEKERSIPIAFMGSFMDPLEIAEKWVEKLPQDIFESLIQAADATLKTPELTYQKAFTLYVGKYELIQTFSPEYLASLMASLDLYVRAQERINLLKALKGFEVHIYGSKEKNRCWNDFLDIKGGNYILHGPLDFEKALDVMKNTKILLNSSPMFKTGAHERIFYGLGQGALVLTNETPWVTSHFEKDEILLHNPNREEEMRDSIRILLENPSRIAEIAQKGQTKVMKEHTWDARAQSLIEILKLI